MIFVFLVLAPGLGILKAFMFSYILINTGYRVYSISSDDLTCWDIVPCTN